MVLAKYFLNYIFKIQQLHPKYIKTQNEKKKKKIQPIHEGNLKSDNSKSQV